MIPSVVRERRRVLNYVAQPLLAGQRDERNDVAERGIVLHESSTGCHGCGAIGTSNLDGHGSTIRDRTVYALCGEFDANIVRQAAEVGLDNGGLEKRSLEMKLGASAGCGILLVSLIGGNLLGSLLGGSWRQRRLRCDVGIWMEG
jgi:hypothetical protein